MKRRTVVKYLFAIGGMAVLPSCLHKESKSALALKNLSISAEEEAMLAEFAETLLPASSTPGAKDTYAHLYALRIVDDCVEKETQLKFLKGIAAVEEMTRNNHSTNFSKASVVQRTQILSALEANKASDDALQFYKLMKNLTIQGYLTSKPVLGDIFHYELVPGRYNGTFPVKTILRQA